MEENPSTGRRMQFYPLPHHSTGIEEMFQACTPMHMPFLHNQPGNKQNLTWRSPGSNRGPSWLDQHSVHREKFFAEGFDGSLTHKSYIVHQVVSKSDNLALIILKAKRAKIRFKLGCVRSTSLRRHLELWHRNCGLYSRCF